MSVERSRSGRVRAWMLTALCLWLAPSVAAAGDKALAETLFVQARKLMEAERYADACPKLERSNLEDPSAGTMFNLALCYEKLGRSASAWAMYKQTVVRAKNEGRTKHAEAARTAAERLEPELSMLTISAPQPVPSGLVVRRGEVTLGRETLGVPVAVDPGEYSIVASAPGHESFATKVLVAPRSGEHKVRIPVLTEAPKARNDVAPSPTLPRDTHAARGSKTLGILLVGTGAAVTSVGLVFGYFARQQATDAEHDPALCPDKRCTPAGLDEIEAAKTKALISTIGVGVGLASVGAGVYFLVSSSNGPEHAARAPARMRVVPVATTNGAVLSLAGSF